MWSMGGQQITTRGANNKKGLRNYTKSFLSGGPPETRTPDQLIKSYQCSYKGPFSFTNSLNILALGQHRSSAGIRTPPSISNFKGLHEY